MLLVLKDLFIPGSFPFLLIALAIGVLLLYWRKDGGRAGRWLLTAVALFYWAVSTPIVVEGLIRVLTPDYPPVRAREQARGASAVVLLGAGMDIYRSRGDLFEVETREAALRAMEAARVYHALDRPWVVVTGGLGSERQTEAARMVTALASLGVPADRIVTEDQATNTHEHAVYVPPLLAERQVRQFVLVTSRQHIARALLVFRKTGYDPVPSTPEAIAREDGVWRMLVPSIGTLLCAQGIFYDKGAMVYYRLRGWI